MKNNEKHLFRRKIGTRIISLLLTVLVIFFAVPYVAYAETAEALNNLAGEEETTLLSYGEEAAVGGAEIYEAEELRGENTKHFRLTDGSYVLAVYPTNVHRLNEEGKYEDINNRLYNLLGDVINFDGNVKFSKKITGNSKIFTIHSGEGKITFSLTGAKKGTNAEIINNEDDESENELQKKINLENLSSTVIYRDILNGTDIEYVLNGSGIKENIIIKERLDNYSYSFEIAANGYSLQAQDDGSIAVLEEGGEKAFVIPAPIIFDSNGEYGCAEYKLSDENKSGKYILTVAPDYEWINSEERIFPITLDPAIYPSDNYVFDTFTDSNNPSVSYASDAYYYVSESKTTYWKTSNLSFVPKNVYISEVNLVYQLAGETPEAYIGVYPVTTDWNESLTYNKTVASSPQGALGTGSITYTHVKANEDEENDYVFFDITEAFKGWIDDPSQNFGVALKYLLGGEVKFLSPRSTTASVPCLQINYVNQNGIEAYNSYSSHRAGEIANGYVNLATGSLSMDIPLLTLTNSVMPYTLSLVYDSKNANSFINKSAGNVPYTTRIAPYGYKWSSQQSVVKTTYTDIFSQTNYLYIWCDADGTEHSFFLSEKPGVYKDDGGLGYKLKEASGKVTITFNDKSVYTFSSITTPSGYVGAWQLSSISDKNGNKLEFVFNSSNYKPTSIKFFPSGTTSGVEVVRFVYSSDSSTVPRAVYDPLTGRGVILSCSETYNSSDSSAYSQYLRIVNYVTGTSAWTDSRWLNYISGNNISSLKISYTSAGYPSNVVENVSKIGVSYTYSGNKVSSVYENNGSVTGQKLTYTYGVGYTDVRSSGSDDAHANDDDIITRYIFDTYGRAVSVYNRNVYGTRVFGGTSGVYETEENAKNNLEHVVSLKEGSINYLVNGDFENVDDAFENWSKTSGVTAEADYSKEPYSTKRVKMSISGQVTQKIYQTVYLKAGTYTLSLDFATIYAAGVTVGANIVNTENSSDSRYISFSTSEQLNDYNQARSVKRVASAFTIDSASTYRVEIVAVGSASASGASIYIDNVMLTFGSEMAAYNMVDIGGFDSFAYDTSSNSVYWSDVWTYSSSSVALGATSISGNSLYIGSNGVTSKGEVTQTVFSSSAGSTIVYYDQKFVLSGFAKSINAKRSDDAKFALKAVVVYSDNTKEEFRFDFVSTCTDWQYVSGTFEIKAYSTIKKIDVVCEFSGQINAYAYFDNITLINASDYSFLDYTYHKNGKVRTVTDRRGNVEYYTYNADDQIKAKATSTGLLYEYEYDTRGNIVGETLYNYYTIQYGQGGIIVYPVDLENPNSLIDKTTLLRTVYSYNAYGLLVSEATNSYVNGVIDTVSLTNTYTYDTSSQVFFGTLKTHTDTLGNTVRYFYTLTSTGIVSATVNEATQSGTAVYTDIWGNLEKAVPVINVTATGYTEESDSEYVRYSYNAKNQLSSIYTDSTGYTFAYDSYGNQRLIMAGSNTLASYEYNPNNGKLKKVTYGNGFTVEYFYNDLENISEIWYTVNGSSNLAYKYTYTESGLLHKVEDVRNSKAVTYNYDKNGRLIFASEYSTADMHADFTANVDYDDMGNVSFLNYMLSYKSSGQVYDKNFYHYYYYDDIQRLESERLTLGSSIYADTSYVYDSFHRLSSATLNYEDTFILKTDYTFTANGSKTSSQVSGYKNTINGSVTSNLTYEYDGNGNILSIKVGSAKKYRYKYDNLGQLIREDNVPESKTYVYIYDNAGNITEKRIYALTAYSVEPSGSYTSVPYVYSTGTWGDLLTSYNGGSITYDSIGNPLSYYNGNNFTWEGRRLVGAVVGSKTLSFAYNDEGIRTSKTVNGVKTNYYYYGSQLLAEETNGNVTVYLYNSTGLIGFQYHGASYSATAWDTYFYEKNLQGDIVAVYDANGVKKVSYVYNAWGATTTTYHNGASASTVSNPFTYRGYYYDKDLGLYYLMSRYYDANICRFVNADGQLNTDSILGYNMFAYCENNPVNRIDPDGHVWKNIKNWFSSAWNNVKKAASPLVEAIKEKAYAAYYDITKRHFEDREAKNGTHPTYEEVSDKNSGWTLLPESQSIYHDNGIGNPELKYTAADGREAVFDGDTLEPMTDPRYIATYNYCPLYQVPPTGPVISDYVKFACSGVGHFVLDMLPYYLTGNSNTREQFESKLLIFD